MKEDPSALTPITLIRRDLIAGLTVATVAVPQAMAYALIAGVDPQYGLFTAIIVTAVASIFGSCPQLINGPTNAISLVVLSAIAGLNLKPGTEAFHSAVFLLAILVGVTQIVLALLKLGDLTRYVSESVILGFMAGAGLLIALSQIPNLLGIPSQGEGHQHFLYRLWLTLTQPGMSIQWYSVAIGLGTVGMIVALRFVSKKLKIEIPELLLALLLISLIVWILQQSLSLNLERLDQVPQQLPRLQLPKAAHLDWIPSLSGSALAIALLGLLEALAIAKSISAKTRQPLDYNKQCMAEGLANLGGGLLQCMPGSGSLTRSAINYQAGAVTRWSGIFSAIAVGAILLLCAPFARFIPLPALAGLLLVTAWRLIDRGRLRYCWRASRFDAGLATVTACSVVLLSVEFSILVGTFLSFLLLVPRAARLQSIELVVSPERVVRERMSSDPSCDRILIRSLEGELFFGAAPELENAFSGLKKGVEEGAKIIVLRLKQARNPDMVCMELIQHFVQEMQQRDVPVLLCGVRQDIQQAMQRLRFHHWLPEEWVYKENGGAESATLEAVRHAYRILGENYCEDCPRRNDGGSNGENWYYMI